MVCLSSHWGFLVQLLQMVAVMMAVNASHMTAFSSLLKVSTFNKDVEENTVRAAGLFGKLEKTALDSERRWICLREPEPEVERQGCTQLSVCFLLWLTPPPLVSLGLGFLQGVLQGLSSNR